LRLFLLQREGISRPGRLFKTRDPIWGTPTLDTRRRFSDSMGDSFIEEASRSYPADQANFSGPALFSPRVGVNPRTGGSPFVAWLGLCGGIFLRHGEQEEVSILFLSSSR